MIEWDDILIIGDSFCACRSDSKFWPNLLCTKLSNSVKPSPRGGGFGGTSWWSGRKKLIEELAYRIPKILIMCHTEPQRIPNDYDIPLNMVSVSDIAPLSSQYPNLTSKFPLNDFSRAAIQYYKYLHSEDFYNWAIIQWYQELDYLSKDISKVIHLHSFIDSVYAHETGISCLTPLFDWASEPLKIGSSTHANHMSLEENAKLAQILYDVILKYNTKTFTI
jgi:hypothetical protein